MTRRVWTRFWPTYRDQPALLATLGNQANLVEKIVQRGGLLQMEILGGSPLPEHFLPVIMSYRHALELLAAISALIRASGVDPCKILLRCVFEALLSTEYILEEDTEKRGMAFLVCHVQQRMRLYEKVDPSTEPGRSWRENVRRDKSLKGFEFARIPDCQPFRERLSRVLTSPNYADAAREYERLRREKRHRPRWYQLFGGPANLEEMSRRLNSLAVYDQIYRNWSGAVHGTDLLAGRLQKGESGTADIANINLVSEGPTVTLVSVALGLRMLRNMIQKFGSEDDLKFHGGWYQYHIQEEQGALRKATSSDDFRF